MSLKEASMNDTKIHLFHAINQIYIKESSLTCVKCHDWLHREIYTHSDGNLYCTSCSSEPPEDADRRRHDILEDCLKDLLFPCKYAGCDSILKREQVADHECSSLHRSAVHCNLCNCNNLNETRFIEHLKTEHKDIVTSLSLNKPAFLVDFDEGNISVMYIVTFFQHSFVAYIQRNDSKLSVDVAKIKDCNGNIDNYENSHCTISFASSNKKYSYNKAFIHCSELYINQNNVDMYVKDHESIDIEVKLYNSTNCMNMPSCPICFFEIGAEVYQCGNGHNVCNVCGKLADTCAICRDGILTPVKLNRLFTNVSMLCENSGKGCLAVVKEVDIDAHASECSYKSVECLYCGVEYTKCDCISHFKQKHVLCTNFKIFYETFQYYLNALNCYVLFKKQVFVFKCTITGSGDNRKICYAVQLLHCENIEEAQRYSFQVHILGLGDSQFTKVILRGLCQTSSDNDYSVSIYYKTCAKYFVEEEDDRWTFIFRYGIIEIGDV